MKSIRYGNHREGTQTSTSLTWHCTHMHRHCTLAFVQDLAAMVDSQQNQIDRIGEVAEESKARTQSGLEHIQQGLLALCGPTEASIDADIREEATQQQLNGTRAPSTPLEELLRLVEEIQGHWQERLVESGCHSTFMACVESPSPKQSENQFAHGY